MAGNEVQNFIPKMKTTTIGQSFSGRRELLPVNRRGINIIAMLMELKKTMRFASKR
jgi:hypothetical protein